MQAIKDFNEGRMGVIPARKVPHRTSEDASV
jgi:hypothetical protein